MVEEIVLTVMSPARKSGHPIKKEQYQCQTIIHDNKKKMRNADEQPMWNADTINVFGRSARNWISGEQHNSGRCQQTQRGGKSLSLSADAPPPNTYVRPPVTDGSIQ